MACFQLVILFQLA